MNYYRRYVGDYLRDTARLSMLEHGAYSLMLDYSYADEQPLPLDMTELYTMVRAMTPADRKAVDKVLNLYFRKMPDGFHQKRVDKEIAVSKTARTNGANGGRPKTEDVTGCETRNGTEHVTGCETEDVTEEGGGTVHPPTTNHQPPPSSPLPTIHQPTPVARAKKPRAPRKEMLPAKTAETWSAYSRAYFERYKVEPKPNAKVNTHLAQLIERIGSEEAPQVAAFFLRCNKAYYVSRKHPVSVLLNDAETLHTEWVIGRSGTETEARQADRTQALGNVFGPMIEEARKRESNGSK